MRLSGNLPTTQLYLQVEAMIQITTVSGMRWYGNKAKKKYKNFEYFEWLYSCVIMFPYSLEMYNKTIIGWGYGKIIKVKVGVI